MTKTTNITKDQIMYILAYALAAENLDGEEIPDEEWVNAIKILLSFSGTKH